MHQDSKFLVVFAFFACICLAGCGDNGSSSGPEGGESSVAEESSSSIEVSSSSVNGDSGFPEQGPGQALAGMTMSEGCDSRDARLTALLQNPESSAPRSRRRLLQLPLRS